MLSILMSMAVENSSGWCCSSCLYYLVLVLALVGGGYYLYSKLFGVDPIPAHHRNMAQNPPSQRQPEKNIDPNRIFTLEELKKYDGSDVNGPIYIGLKGKVYDVTSAESFYGPGGPYACFAGRDASRGLSKMELEYTSADISDLGPYEKYTLTEWEEKFSVKYPLVGKIIDPSLPNSGPKAPEGERKEGDGSAMAKHADSNPAVQGAAAATS